MTIKLTAKQQEEVREFDKLSKEDKEIVRISQKLGKVRLTESEQVLLNNYIRNSKIKSNIQEEKKEAKFSKFKKGKSYLGFTRSGDSRNFKCTGISKCGTKIKGIFNNSKESIYMITNLKDTQSIDVDKRYGMIITADKEVK